MYMSYRHPTSPNITVDNGCWLMNQDKKFIMLIVIRQQV